MAYFVPLKLHPELIPQMGQVGVIPLAWVYLKMVLPEDPAWWSPLTFWYLRGKLDKVGLNPGFKSWKLCDLGQYNFSELLLCFLYVYRWAVS